MEIHLPAVPLAEIFSYLDGFSLLQAAQVNKSWNVVADRESLWRRLCLRKWCFGDVTREHLCTQLWQQLGAQTWKQFFLHRTRQERCMEWARLDDFIYREIAGDYGDFGFVKYLSGSGLTMDGQGKSILCTVSDKGTLSTWDAQEGIMIWSSPVQQNFINNLATLPEMQLAITADMERTIKVWNCCDRDAVATHIMPHECFTLKAFLTKDGPFLLVGDYEGDIYTFIIPSLWCVSKVKAFEYPVQFLHCSPDNRWVFTSKLHESILPKVYLTECLLKPSEYCSPLYACLPFPLCFKACWTPRRENRITLMYRTHTHKFIGFITFDLRLEKNGNKERVLAQQIANFLLPPHIDFPMLMGISDENVIVFGSGPYLFLYTIDGLQLHRFDNHQNDITTLWVDSLHVLATSQDGSLHVYMWEEGGRHLKSCCHLENMKSLPPHWLQCRGLRQKAEGKKAKRSSWTSFKRPLVGPHQLLYLISTPGPAMRKKNHTPLGGGDSRSWPGHVGKRR
ncbi:F-box/WD repeat-containing protein 12-like [Nannospalax galili]|uniref:F-box/WD repeat-containing protein 12-like n=1 Tax=Nannospalax galili TaxID=1026970 RepID=UPI000819DB2B|nr:F-box/WD repeat-containing protein 12-like [Nannospalax galili]